MNEKCNVFLGYTARETIFSIANSVVIVCILTLMGIILPVISSGISRT